MAFEGRHGVYVNRYRCAYLYTEVRGSCTDEPEGSPNMNLLDHVPRLVRHGVQHLIESEASYRVSLSVREYCTSVKI